MPWSICDAFDDPSDALSCWQTLFLEAADNQAPLTEHRVKKVKQPDLFSEYIKRSLNLSKKEKLPTTEI